MLEFCYICYSQNELFNCDFCCENYCYECSYTFGIHFQYQGSSCYSCCDQQRRNKLRKDEIRDNKINLFLDRNNNI
jgi:hypothetical protein